METTMLSSFSSAKSPALQAYGSAKPLSDTTGRICESVPQVSLLEDGISRAPSILLAKSPQRHDCTG